ncbi:hypothetical protein [Bradyrhizobium liaoningense]|uniref:hypothetical protein n=1 Tax=Bradyrhizobium liaoningense TaxID=43992 RepID=UPI001BA5EB2C|nr:hypothetical protein [Bradyrhizobium liaoningense]MBR0904144.1 hypothetical protein [Bradyrhizobium liaoningense]
MTFSVRFDAKNRSIGIGICANLWTVERLELMAWTRAERSSFCVLLPQIACFKLVCPVSRSWDFCTRIALLCRQMGGSYER